jgi:hypothetical protein
MNRPPPARRDGPGLRRAARLAVPERTHHANRGSPEMLTAPFPLATLPRALQSGEGPEGLAQLAQFGGGFRDFA